MEIVFSDGVQSAGAYAFYGCTNLAVIDLGPVTSVGERAFMNCTKLRSAVLGSVMSIAENAFDGCYNFVSLEFASDLQTVGTDAFKGLTFYAENTPVDPTAVNLQGRTWIGSGDAKLYFRQPENVYVVYFVENGGSCQTTFMETGTDHKLHELPQVTREGYGPGEWFIKIEGGEKVTTDTVFSSNTVVYAHWNAGADGNIDWYISGDTLTLSRNAE